MLFTSYTFIAFMAVVFLAYYLVPKKAQWPLLLYEIADIVEILLEFSNVVVLLQELKSL